MQAWYTFAEWIRRHYQSVILITLLIGLLLGSVTTAPGRALQPASQALTFLMILLISLAITPRQLGMVTQQPGVVMVGLALNFIFMPLLCWGLAWTLVRDPELATGIILVGVVPCAGMAVVWTALLKGDVPLGMSINALTMVLAPFLIPPSMALLAGSSVAMSPTNMFGQLALILLLPLVLGIALRVLADRYWNIKPWLPLLPALSALTAVLLMFMVINVNTPLLLTRGVLSLRLLAAVALIFLIGFLVPYWLNRFGLARPQRLAITYSAGMKNLPIAVGLAMAAFPGRLSVGLPVALAFVAQMLVAGLFYRYLQAHAPE